MALPTEPGAPAARARADLRPAAAGIPDEVVERVRELVELVADAGVTPGEGILLDVEVEGVRCLLQRRAAAPASLALSPRQGEIALLVATGRTNRSIARSLGISEWTVNSHLRRIYEKLGVRSRAEMVAKVLGLGLHLSAAL
jgi:DNA-binding CsgD family transcriptional regulator